MALIACPECNGQLSEAAAACPHCGKPMARPFGAVAEEVPQPTNIAKQRSWFGQTDAIHGCASAPLFGCLGLILLGTLVAFFQMCAHR